MERTIRTSIGEVTLMDEGIVHVRAFQNAEVSLEMAKEYFEVVAYLCEERPHSTILDISGVTFVSKEAREWLRDRSSEWGKTVSAALITGSFTSRAIGQIFLRFNRPSFPVRIFDNLDHANLWARKNYRTYMACQEVLG